jgi:hypothetical protein
MVNCPGIFLVWCGPQQPQPGLAEAMHIPVKPINTPSKARKLQQS